MRRIFSFRLFSVITFFTRCLFSKRSNAVIRRVSIICLLGLIVSTGSLIVIFSVMGGLGQTIRDKFLASEPHVIITWKSSTQPDLLGTNLIEKKKNKIQHILQTTGLDTGVAGFYFFETTDLVVKTADGVFSGAIARGYEPEYLKFFLTTLRSNKVSPFIHLDKMREFQAREVLLGEEPIFIIEQAHLKPVSEKKIIMSLGLASELNLYEGEQVHLIPAESLLLPPSEPIDFELAQVDQVVSAQSESWNSNFIFYNRQIFNFSENSSYLPGFEIRLKDPKQYAVYQKVLEKEGFLIEVWPERNSSIFFALKLEKIIMSLFLSLAGLITLLAVSSLLVLLIVQKKREIGALLAIGFPIQKIRRIFIGIGLLLCVFGILGGSLLGLFTCFLLQKAPLHFLPFFYQEGLLPVEFHLSFFVWFPICALCVSFLSCWFSVQTQLRHTPTDLLKSLQG